ncbi:hypothetical protein EJ08DRAFT_703012 [Tothia fuscella]|uniref:Uncharacterized protein n=1 Tax=Tothia fuscella TaxID=1048955 RepID=A0A9P4NF44_9PEZI|nr:hypothetical protein EJ08DRAFT_703012 [Tothia fuscella]
MTSLMQLNGTGTSNYYIHEDPSQDSFQAAWTSNVTACWRLATDLNITYLAVARVDSRPRTAQVIGNAFTELAGCCEAPGNLYFAHSGCGGVACYTNDRVRVEQWNSCTAQKRDDISVFASKIDYKFLKDKSEEWQKKNGAGSVLFAKKGWLLVGCVVGSMLLSIVA